MPKHNNIPLKEQRALLLKEADTDYGIVTKKLGNGRFSIKIRDKDVIGRLCGKFRKGSSKKDNWVDVDTVVLVGVRDFQENVVDIIYVYTQQEVRQLKKQGEIEEETVEQETVEQETFDFDEI